MGPSLIIGRRVRRRWSDDQVFLVGLTVMSVHASWLEFIEENEIAMEKILNCVRCSNLSK